MDLPRESHTGSVSKILAPALSPRLPSGKKSAICLAAAALEHGVKSVGGRCLMGVWTSP
jgi:hypothetical protein